MMMCLPEHITHLGWSPQFPEVVLHLRRQRHPFFFTNLKQHLATYGLYCYMQFGQSEPPVQQMTIMHAQSGFVSDNSLKWLVMLWFPCCHTNQGTTTIFRR